jgi:ABC-type multidrug transport system fused ATPase/permease subunit
VSKPLSVSDLGNLVNQLRNTSARISEARTRLEKDFATRKASLTRQADAELQRLQEEQSARRAEITSAAQERIAHFESRAAERKSQIIKASGASRRQGLDRIDEAEGRRKFAVQKGLLDAERNRDQRIAELDREWSEFQLGTEGLRYRAATLREMARRSFRAYPNFPRLLRKSAQPAADKATEPSNLLDQAEAHFKRYQARLFPVLFRFAPIWLWWLIGVGLLFAGPAQLGLSAVPQSQFQQTVFIALGLVTVLYFLGWRLCAPIAKTFAELLSRAEQSIETLSQQTHADYLSESETTRSTAAERIAALQQEWDSAVSEAAEARRLNDHRVEGKMQRALKLNERLYSSNRAEGEKKLARATASLDTSDEFSINELKTRWQSRLQQLQTDFDTQRSALEKEWNELILPAQERLTFAQAFAKSHFHPWAQDTAFKAPDSALNAIQFGAADIEFPSPINDRPDCAFRATAPLMLVLPSEGSIIFESDEAGRESAISSINNIIFRILQTVPPGKVSFTLIDPVRLGQSFSSIMHLADFEENIVNRRIWTEPAEIEERLVELNAHMEKVIQMYLRNEFRDIVAYNKEAGRIAEKFHFLVLADFPANFTDTAMRRLNKIAASGARCGVYTLIHWDRRHAFLPGHESNDFVSNAVHLVTTRSGAVAPAFAGGGLSFQLDPPPAPELATRFLQQVGEASRGSNTVQVPFSQIAPKTEERWSLETTDELRVPIGRSGATKLQHFALGKGTRQHVLIAGKTGSGKSTLLHVLITNLSLWAGPDQVEFYLVDFKKGVEFKDYAVAKLPHARVVAIESDREFGLSVLRRVDEELRVRGELFRAVGAQDIAGYKRASGNGRMPRILLIIDEFQELFVEDDAISQNAALLLDRVVRQGRAFGIHVVLGSQTLGGAYSLARSTLGQMVVRIALQTSEADAYLIMDENNPAPRLLSRPGEGIYNDSGGALEANSPFQVVWLPESERREALQEVRSQGIARGESNEPIVFEGNTLADISENSELRHLLDSTKDRLAAAGSTVWLGLPNEIKGPTRVLLDRRSGRNLLIAGQHEDHARALLAAALISLAAQNSPRNIRFFILETQSTGSHLSLSNLAAKLPHEVTVATPGDLPAIMRSLVDEIERREAGQGGPQAFLIIQNLPAFKSLRPEDEFSISFDEGKTSPAADFQRIYTDGPIHGIHVIAHVDGFNNANRFLGRKGLKEFSPRVLFQMSASDSASLADDPRAGTLGLARALLYDEHEGTYETFRPYARPASDWLNELEEKLRRTHRLLTPCE